MFGFFNKNKKIKNTLVNPLLSQEELIGIQEKHIEALETIIEQRDVMIRNMSKFGTFTDKYRKIIDDYITMINSYASPKNMPIYPPKDKDKDNWYYDHQTDSYLFGENKNGCGVFIENGKWTGNANVGDVIINIGEFDIFENAQNKAIRLWKKMNG